MLKKFFSVALVVCLLLSFCGCAFLPFDIGGSSISKKEKNEDPFDELVEWIKEEGELSDDLYTMTYVFDEDEDYITKFCLTYDAEDKTIMCTNMNYLDGEDTASFSDVFWLDEDLERCEYLSIMYDDYYDDGYVYCYDGDFEISSFSQDTIVDYDSYDTNVDTITADKDSLSTSIHLIVWNLKDALEGKVGDYGKAPVKLKDLGFKSW